jgi:hypothetical protein
MTLPRLIQLKACNEQKILDGEVAIEQIIAIAGSRVMT